VAFCLSVWGSGSDHSSIPEPWLVLWTSSSAGILCWAPPPPCLPPRAERRVNEDVPHPRSQPACPWQTLSDCHHFRTQGSSRSPKPRGTHGHLSRRSLEQRQMQGQRRTGWHSQSSVISAPRDTRTAQRTGTSCCLGCTVRTVRAEDLVSPELLSMGQQDLCPHTWPSSGCQAAARGWGGDTGPLGALGAESRGQCLHRPSGTWTSKRPELPCPRWGPPPWVTCCVGPSDRADRALAPPRPALGTSRPVWGLGSRPLTAPGSHHSFICPGSRG
jgi:hypothetical protein